MHQELGGLGRRASVVRVLCAMLVLVPAWTLAAAQEGVLVGPCWVVEVLDGDTIKVRLPDEHVEEVRYVGIDAPELGDVRFLGPEAHAVNAALVGRTHVWLEVERQDDGLLRHAGRLLAYVFRDEARTQLVQEELLRQGLALVDKREIVDRELHPGAFRIRYADALIEAQIDAATARRGLWALAGFHAERELVVAAVRHWGEREVAYLVNRGDDPVELAAGWVLMNRTGYGQWVEGARTGVSMVHLGDYLGPTCLLEAGGVLEVWTGPDIPQAQLHARSGCGSERVVFRWTRRKIWRNDGDTGVLIGPDGELWHRLPYPMRWEELVP